MHSISFLFDSINSFGPFYTPRFQRTYSWKDEQNKDLLRDLIITSERSKRDDDYQHYLGSIFVNRIKTKSGQKRQELLDGQQRISSLMLLLAALGNVAKELRNNLTNSINKANIPQEKKDKLKDTANRNTPYGKLSTLIGSIQSKLFDRNGRQILKIGKSVSGPDFNKYFRAVIKNLNDGGYNNLPRLKKSQGPIKNMYNAYMLYNKKLLTIAKKDNGIIRLDDLYHSLLYKFQVVIVNSPNSESAFEIFETLNTRGRSLTEADKIKNYTMSLMGSKWISKSGEYWSNINDVLDNRENNIQKFMRSYWLARGKYTSNNALYRSIKSVFIKKKRNNAQLSDFDLSENFLKNAQSLVDVYAALKRPDKTKYRNFFTDSNVANELSYILSRLTVKIYYPIIISMEYKNYSDNDIAKALKNILYVFCKNRYVVGRTNNRLEPKFVHIAEDIWHESSNTFINQIDKKIQNLSLNDRCNDILSTIDFDYTTGGKRWFMEYIFFSIYNLQNNNNQANYKSIFVNDKYDLVHVQPIQNITNHHDIEIHDSYDNDKNMFFNRIGNWTLIDKESKKEITKHPERTVKLLQLSEIPANQKLASFIKNNGWDYSDIQKRQNKLRSKLIKLWE